MSKTKNKSDNKTEKALAAEKEQFNKQQVRFFIYIYIYLAGGFKCLNFKFVISGALLAQLKECH